jgi:hypothetical protein
VTRFAAEEHLKWRQGQARLAGYFDGHLARAITNAILSLSTVGIGCRMPALAGLAFLGRVGDRCSVNCSGRT